jgi:tetratricopeptide (TPR) repeat protein
MPTPTLPTSARTPISLFLTTLAAALYLTGCAATNQPKEESLQAAYRELAIPTPNHAAMIAAADAYLAAQPSAPDAAHALYLRGRALEEKAQRDPASPQKDLADAFAFYTQAMTKNPRPALEGLIHAGLGNTLYFQDRYAHAANELAAATQTLERDNDKAWALYRIGLCHQRLGQWETADATFAAVQQAYPSTEQARRAAEHHGARAYYVQVAAYQNPTTADTTVTDLKKQGLPAQRFAEQGGQNLQLVRVGPFPTYDSAHQTRQRVWSKYQTATVIP